MRFTRVLPAVLAFALLALPALAATQNPTRGSLKRFSGGVVIQPVIYEPDTLGMRTSGFLPSVYFGYSAAQRINAYSNYSRDFARELGIFAAGGSFALSGFLPEDRLASGFGVEFVHYDGDGAAPFLERDSWRGLVRLAYVVLKTKGATGRDLAYFVFKGAYDPENREKFWTGGVQIQFFGGSPATEESSGAIPEKPDEVAAVPAVFDGRQSETSSLIRWF